MYINLGIRVMGEAAFLHFHHFLKNIYTTLKNRNLNSNSVYFFKCVSKLNDRNYGKLRSSICLWRHYFRGCSSEKFFFLPSLNPDLVQSFQYKESKTSGVCGQGRQSSKLEDKWSTVNEERDVHISSQYPQISVWEFTILNVFVIAPCVLPPCIAV